MESTGTSEGAGAPHPRRAHKGATAPRGDALRAPRDPPQPRTSPLGEQKGPRPGWTGARRARLARDPPSQPFSARPQGCEAPAGGGAGAVRAGAGAGGSAGTEPPEPAAPRRARGGERGKGRARPAALTPSGGAPSRPPGARYLAAALRVPGLRPRHARLRLLEAPTAAAQSGPAAMSAAPRAALWGRAGGRAPGAGGSPRPGSL